MVVESSKLRLTFKYQREVPTPNFQLSSKKLKEFKQITKSLELTAWLPIFCAAAQFNRWAQDAQSISWEKGIRTEYEFHMTTKAIILITTDEQHRDSLSWNGATAISTPNIDSIAENGVSFDRAYSASPICLPSRCSIATGLYPHNSRSYSNIVGASLKTCWPNIMQVCRDFGYRTSLHGKGHFMPCPYAQTRNDITQDLDAVKPFYESLGFDHVDLQDDKNNSLWFYDDYSRELEQRGLLKACRDARMGRVNKHAAGYFFPGDAGMHADSWVGRKTVEHINRAGTAQPHFIWASFSGPHYPIDAHRDFYDRVNISTDIPRVRRDEEWNHPNKLGYASYHGPGGSEGADHAKDGKQKNFSQEYWREWRRMYYGNIVQIDDWVGQILQAAEDKWGDDVMVIFTADHGDMMGNHDLWGKNSLMFDDILRVPLFLQYPRSKHRGRRQELVSLVDLMPTIASEAGCDAGDLQCEGREIVSLADSGGRDVVLCEADNRFAAIFKDGNKYVKSFMPGHECDAQGRQNSLHYEEWYDLRRDPHEFENLINSISADTLPASLCALREDYTDAIELLFRHDYQEAPPWYFSK